MKVSEIPGRVLFLQLLNRDIMDIERYQTSISIDHKVYSFVSIGDKVNFIKKVIISETDQDGLYNFCLGDYNAGTKEIDYFFILADGDKDKILKTAVACIFSFFKYIPKAWVYWIWKYN